MARGAIYDNCLHRLMQSPHHLEAQALAKTHSLYLSNLTYMRPPPLNVALPYWLERSRNSIVQSTPNTPTPGTTLYTYKDHSDVVLSVAWSPSSKYIASGYMDGTVQVRVH
jgi:WD40 repeat protein